ncbi:MAG: matrixin family metalloprotease [Pirellulaceae bacterium]|nr:matrixin family metalloprotease [Pirellulaceae bacterium]
MTHHHEQTFHWALVMSVFAALLLLSVSCLPVDAVEQVYVKLYVDEEERLDDQRWQHRSRTRLHAASKILERYSGIRFTISDFGRWLSDNEKMEFAESLREFEQEVSVGRNEIAVGFTSQYRFQRRRHRLGGTRGPLHTHILIRENNPRAIENERLEVFVHELGHFLGAVHSDRHDSVMRPVLGDGQARSRRFQIGFDQKNAQIIRLVSNEVRFLDVRRFHQLSTSTKDTLRNLYAEMAETFPQDPAARQFLQLIR